MGLGRHQRDWEELTEFDALRAILAAPLELEEFFAVGQAEVTHVLGQAAGLGRPAGHERALDFGCGVGRLTRALSDHFDKAHGVDIAEGMIARAAELNADRPGCRFSVNAHPDLRSFESGSFDLAFASIVLQHMPTRRIAETYIQELVRVTRGDGLLIFQMPLHLPLKNRVQPRRRLYSALRRAGVGERRLYRAGLTPMRMIALDEARVRRVVEEAGGRVVLTEPSAAAPPYPSLVYYVVPPSAESVERNSTQSFRAAVSHE